MKKILFLTAVSLMSLASYAQEHTKEYSLQVRNSLEEPWKTVDTVYDNDDYQTDRRLKEPVQARYVRLDVTKADQNDGIKVRIYEFAVY